MTDGNPSAGKSQLNPDAGVNSGKLPHLDRSGRATLRTIAAISGVHVTTVSRVLKPSADRPWAASRETGDRVMQIAREVGYIPNPHATGLRTQSSNLIGVLAPRMSDPVFATVYEGIEEAAALLGRQTVVTNTRDVPEQRQAKAEMLLSRRVDGLILGDSPLDGEFADELERRGVPFVLVARRASHHVSVTTDDFEGGRLAARHLLELGHRDVAVIAGEPYASTGTDRRDGFLEMYADAGYPLPPAMVRQSHFDVDGGRDASATILAAANNLTAIFAVNDYAAIGALGVLREHGLTAGRDVAVVGYNDLALAAQLPIPLSSVRAPLYQTGQRAATLLHEKLSGHDIQSERLPPQLIIRESSRATDGQPFGVRAGRSTRPA